MLNRSIFFIVIGALAVVATAAGYLYCQECQCDIDIEIDEYGLFIDGM